VKKINIINNTVGVCRTTASFSFSIFIIVGSGSGVDRDPDGVRIQAGKNDHKKEKSKEISCLEVLVASKSAIEA
jgi:hypothetical protein